MGDLMAEILAEEVHKSTNIVVFDNIKISKIFLVFSRKTLPICDILVDTKSAAVVEMLELDFNIYIGFSIEIPGQVKYIVY